MTGKRYYITTVADWQRHAARFAHSHWLTLETAQTGAASNAPTTDAPIFALIEADEGVHNALEDDAAFEPLPHPLAAKPISERAAAALASHGVAPGATTFDAAEAVSRAHPLLRHRVF